MNLKDIQGAKRTEVIGDGQGIDLRERTIVQRAIIIPAGTPYQLQKNCRIIIGPGVPGTTRLALPPKNTNAYDILIWNRAGNTTMIETNGATIEGLFTPYTLIADSVWLWATDSSTWWAVPILA